MCPSMIEIGLKTAEKNRQTNGHYENNGHLAVNQLECGPMPNVMVALSNRGGALCSTPQFG